MAFTTNKDDSEGLPFAVVDMGAMGQECIYRRKKFVVEDELDERDEAEIDNFLNELSAEELAHLHKLSSHRAFDTYQAPRGLKLCPCPNIEGDRETAYVAGPNGCGKSHFCSLYAKQYMNMTGNKVAIISQKDEDPVFDKIGVIRLPLESIRSTYEYTEPPPGSRARPKKVRVPCDYKAFQDMLLIFDDLDSVSDPELKKDLYDLQRHALNDMRSQNVCVLSTHHRALEGHATKNQIGEADKVIIFPQGDRSGNVGLLRKYLGITLKEARKLLNTDNYPAGGRDSRWVAFCRRAPVHIITERECFTLDSILEGKK